MFFTGKWSILRCVLVLSYFSATHLTSCAFISIPTMIALGIIFIMICLCQCVIKFEVMIRILNCQTYSFWLMSCLLSVACILAVLFVTVVGVDSVHYYHTNITAMYPACSNYNIIGISALAYFCVLTFITCCMVCCCGCFDWDE